MKAFGIIARHRLEECVFLVCQNLEDFIHWPDEHADFLRGCCRQSDFKSLEDDGDNGLYSIYCMNCGYTVKCEAVGGWKYLKMASHLRNRPKNKWVWDEEYRSFWMKANDLKEQLRGPPTWYVMENQMRRPPPSIYGPSSWCVAVHQEERYPNFKMVRARNGA